MLDQGQLLLFSGGGGIELLRKNRADSPHPCKSFEKIWSKLITPLEGMVINTIYFIGGMVTNTQDTNYSIGGMVINIQDTNYFIGGTVIPPERDGN